MLRAVSIAILATASSVAVAEPIRVVASADTGPALSLDDRIGAALAGRLAGERSLGERVALGAGVDASVMHWWGVGSGATEDLLATHLFAQVHVGIQLRRIRLEPGVGGGAIYYRGDHIRGWLPAYSSTIAVVYDRLRAGVRSRNVIGDLAMGTFEPDTELGVFFGAQL